MWRLGLWFEIAHKKSKAALSLHGSIKEEIGVTDTQSLLIPAVVYDFDLLAAPPTYPH
jgi:hypothetical protein